MLLPGASVAVFGFLYAESPMAGKVVGSGFVLVDHEARQKPVYLVQLDEPILAPNAGLAVSVIAVAPTNIVPLHDVETEVTCG